MNAILHFIGCDIFASIDDVLKNRCNMEEMNLLVSQWHRLLAPLEKLQEFDRIFPQTDMRSRGSCKVPNVNQSQNLLLL